MKHEVEGWETRRPAPQRRRKRRKRRVLSYPLRLAALGGAAALALWLMGAVVVKAAYPYWLGYDVGTRVAEARARLKRQSAENEALRARIRYLRSDEGAETLARRAGWRRDGESVIFFSGKPGGDARR
jgi:cell division protein FtsB